MIVENEQRLHGILDSLGIEFIRYEHNAIYTIEEANKLEVSIPGHHCKNLFLRNRKGDVHYLVILQEDKKVDLKNLSEQIKSSSLSFASEERLYKYLQLKPGSVTPFGLINDFNKEVVVLIDKDLKNAEKINFHPNINTATLNISYRDFEKFIEWCGNKFYYVDIG